MSDNSYATSEPASPSPDNSPYGSSEDAPAQSFDANLEQTHQIGHSPEEAPDGTVWAPQLGTYVDADVAGQLGLSSAPTQEQAERDATDQVAEAQQEADTGDQQHWTNDPSLSALDINNAETLLEDSPSDLVSQATEDLGVRPMQEFYHGLESGDYDDALDQLAMTANMDRKTAEGAIDSAVQEAGEMLSGHLPDGAYEALVRAAYNRDQDAVQIVRDFVMGFTEPEDMNAEYARWYHNNAD